MNLAFFPLPEGDRINGDQLESELAIAGYDGRVSLTNDEDVPVVAVVGFTGTEEAVGAVVAAHVPAASSPPPTSDEKIAELVDATSVLTDLVFTLMEGL